jgi:hypothetical protein
MGCKRLRELHRHTSLDEKKYRGSTAARSTRRRAVPPPALGSMEAQTVPAGRRCRQCPGCCVFDR